MIQLTGKTIVMGTKCSAWQLQQIIFAMFELSRSVPVYSVDDPKLKTLRARRRSSAESILLWCRIVLIHLFMGNHSPAGICACRPGGQVRPLGDLRCRRMI